MKSREMYEKSRRRIREGFHPNAESRSYEEVYGKKGIELSSDEAALPAQYAHLFEKVYEKSQRVRG